MCIRVHVKYMCCVFVFVMCYHCCVCVRVVLLLLSLCVCFVSVCVVFVCLFVHLLCVCVCVVFVYLLCCVLPCCVCLFVLFAYVLCLCLCHLAPGLADAEASGQHTWRRRRSVKALRVPPHNLIFNHVIVFHLGKPFLKNGPFRVQNGHCRALFWDPIYSICF